MVVVLPNLRAPAAARLTLLKNTKISKQNAAMLPVQRRGSERVTEQRDGDEARHGSSARGSVPARRPGASRPGSLGQGSEEAMHMTEHFRGSSSGTQEGGLMICICPGGRHAAGSARPHRFLIRDQNNL